MSAAHTKGPWRVSDTFGSVGAIAHEGGFIAFPCAPRSVSDERLEGESWIEMRDRTQAERDLVDAEQKANGLVLAAAPDLLEALQDMLSGWQYIRSTHGDLYGVGWDRAQGKAEAAIRRATGADHV